MPEARLLTGWGRTAPTLAALCRPEHSSDVASLIADSGARGIIARGLGRSYGDAAQNAGGRVLSTTGLAEVLELDEDAGKVTVGAGMSMDALTRLLAPLGWSLPVLPGTGQVTVGGAIASDIHGKNHHRDGSFADHVLAFELLTPTGEPLRVTREETPDAFRATVGGMGLTGVVLAATLRLLRIETTRVSVDTERARDLDDVMARMEVGDAGYRYSVAWIDCLAGGARLGRSVLIRGDHATVEELPAAHREDALRIPPARSIGAPPWAPSGLLNAATVRAFNEVWFRKSPRAERGRLESIPEFFHPLDGVRGWNRLYGARGLLQYQLVVPLGEEATLRAILERLSSARCPSFLAVIKRFGSQDGLLSFPMPGWTLALDMPAAGGELSALLDGLDALVAEAGGRVYLTKDSRLRPELLGTMYPGLDGWRELRARLDPAGTMRSDLARRLALV